MPIEPHRIEAAARGRYERAMNLFPEASRGTWDDMHPTGREFLIAETLRDLEAAFPDLAAGTAWVAPMDDTEEMWGGLARQIVMWNRFGGSSASGTALHQHLSRTTYGVPPWLAEIIPDVDHVPPKGAVAGAIYRAMRDAHLSKGKDDDHG